jgi:hypothetical protein
MGKDTGHLSQNFSNRHVDYMSCLFLFQGWLFAGFPKGLFYKVSYNNYATAYPASWKVVKVYGLHEEAI